MQINSTAYLKNIERSEIGKDGLFCGDYVREVKRVSNSLFGDMCRSAPGAVSYTHLTLPTKRIV